MALKSNLIKFLKTFDAFGETHTFRVNTEKTYNSPVGGFFCLLFIIYTSYYVLFTFSDFLEGKNKTKEYDLMIDPAPSVDMQNHQYFSVAFCLRKENYEVDQFLTSKLKMNFYYSSSKLNEKKTLEVENKELQMKNCAEYNYTSSELSNHQKQYWSDLDKFQLDGCKCVNFDNSQSLNFSSKLEGVEKNSFLMNLNLLDNANSNENNVNNSDIEEIKNYIIKNNPKLHIYFPEYSVNISSNEEPLPIKLHTENFELSPHFTHISEIYLGLLSFTDYYSYTSEDIYNYKNKLVFDSKNSNKLNSIIQNSLMKVSFILSGNSITYRRTYLKIQEFLGNLIGYLGNIILLVYILSSIYNGFGSKRFLSEKFFLRNKKLKNLIKNIKGFKSERFKRKGKGEGKSYIDNDNDNVNNEKNSDPKKDNLIQNIEEKSLGIISSPSIEISQPNPNVNEDSVSQPKDARNITSNDLININNKIRKNNFTIFFYEYVSQYFRYLLCKKQPDRKYDLYKSTEYFYYYYMDISNYLKMMVEFEMLKKILLSKNKRRLVRKFRPFLKRRYRLEYQDKLNNLYNENITDDDVKKITEGVETVVEANEVDTLKVIAKFL